MTGHASSRSHSDGSTMRGMRLNAIARLVGLIFAGLSAGPLGPHAALADALRVLTSTPASGAVLSGPHAEYVIRFDRLVDHESSRLYIAQSGRVIQSLVPRLDSAPEVLFAAGEMPPPGDYELQWQARSPEGAEVSSGVIPFSVSR